MAAPAASGPRIAPDAPHTRPEPLPPAASAHPARPGPDAVTHPVGEAQPPAAGARPANPVPEAPAPAREAGPPAADRLHGTGGLQAAPDPAEERDQARVRMPLPGPRRVVVLGCTSGAGQTVTALMTARVLASLRTEPVAVLDLNPGSGSLARRSRSEPAATVRDLLGGVASVLPDGGRAASGIQVISAGAAPESAQRLDDGDFGAIGRALSGRYQLSLIDPGASAVAKVLAIADQLVLVAPASGDAPRAVSMTQDWLAAHDHRRLAEGAVLVVNGVSSRSTRYAEQAEAIATGRCRAIVRVPWENQLGADGGPCADAVPLQPPARRALTELAGLIVSGLAAAAGESAAGEPR